MNQQILRPGPSIESVYALDPVTRRPMPFFAETISAGFPSPADDYIDRRLDLNELLVRHPAATFFVKVSGDSMTGAGISSGDILIVDRAETPGTGSIIIAALNGELTVKRLVRDGDALLLAPENSAYRPIGITPEMDFQVWGVVIHVIRTVR